MPRCRSRSRSEPSGAAGLAPPRDHAPDQPAALAAHGVHAGAGAAGPELVHLGGVDPADERPREGARGLPSDALGEEDVRVVVDRGKGTFMRI